MSNSNDQSSNVILTAEGADGASDSNENYNSVAANEYNVVRGDGGDDNISGDAGQDSLDGGAGNDTVSGEAAEDKLLGGTGGDQLDSGDGNDLTAGDYVGDEWELIDGQWVYFADRIQETPILSDDPNAPSYDDLIVSGAGEDVLLGNLGHDTLYAGAGDDLINGGSGADRAFGGAGDDVINLENDNDRGYGGEGADTINAGSGDDIVYGDNGDQNLLGNEAADANVNTLSQYDDIPGWVITDGDGFEQMDRTIGTSEGESYTISFDLALNLNAGSTNGKVEVLWNGEVVGTVEPDSGVYKTHSFEVTGAQDASSLSFRVLEMETGAPTVDTSGPIFSYEKTMEIGGQEVTLDAFAPGQAKLFQVIQGQLKVLDPQTETYQDAGAPAAFKVNAVGFNVEDDMIYGIAKSKGTDALGNAVDSPDLVMMDAVGNAYRIGDVTYGDFVGDFDDSGNLWTFNSSLNRMTKIDVDNIDANGNPVTENFALPRDLFTGNIYDIAYNATEGVFYAVAPPPSNGQAGQVLRIDVSDVPNGGEPSIDSVKIDGTLIDGEMHHGMAKGAYGAVFLDGEGNLYFGLNKGDHDLDASTGVKGAVYKVHADFDTGQAHAEFMAESDTTGANDGAVDPRASNPFAEVDTEASVLISNPSVTSNAGGNDVLRGGQGDDVLFGEVGADTISGGTGEDSLSGGTGDDKLNGGADDDILHGDHGNDTLLGGQGNDQLHGGEGQDKLLGGAGDDTLNGGHGDDTLLGQDGDDILDSGHGDDKLYGGSGNDTLLASDGNDTAYGGQGQDSIDGGNGNDLLFGGEGSDTLAGASGNDSLFTGNGNDLALGGSGDDFIQTGTGNDILSGGAGSDKLVGGAGSDTIQGGEGDDHMWGGEWSEDGSSDTFIVTQGGGKDFIHDFETSNDVLDLSSYGIDYADLENVMNDQGWATIIDLGELSDGNPGDQLILKSVSSTDLDENNFIL